MVAGGEAVQRWSAGLRFTPVAALPTSLRHSNRCATHVSRTAKHGAPIAIRILWRCLRRNLEHYALVAAAADDGCAEDVSLGIDCDAAVGLAAVAASGEIVEVGEGPVAIGGS